MKFKSIQLLRAVAVLLVVYAHSIDGVMRVSSSPAAQAHFFYLQNFGAIGVDIFFVISGFIMAYVTKELAGWRDSMSFLIKRFIRIYPLYVLMNIPLIMLFHPGYRKIIRSFTLIFLFDHGTGTKSYIIPVAWTLAYEITFYIIVAIIIGISRNNIALKCIVFLIGLVLTGLIFHPTDLRLHMFTNSILLEFVLGLIIGWAYIDKIQIQKSLTKLLVIVVFTWYLILIIAGFGFISEEQYTRDGSLSLKRVLIWGIPSSLLVFSAVFSENRASLKKISHNKLIQLVGDASYSIYLAHTLFLDGIFYLFKASLAVLQPDICILLVFILATLAGILVHKCIEKPLLSSLKHISMSPALAISKK